MYIWAEPIEFKWIKTLRFFNDMLPHDAGSFQNWRHANELQSYELCNYV